MMGKASLFCSLLLAISTSSMPYHFPSIKIVFEMGFSNPKMFSYCVGKGLKTKDFWQGKKREKTTKDFEKGKGWLSNQCWRPI